MSLAKAPNTFETLICRGHQTRQLDACGTLRRVPTGNYRLWAVVVHWRRKRLPVQMVCWQHVICTSLQMPVPVTLIENYLIPLHVKVVCPASSVAQAGFAVVGFPVYAHLDRVNTSLGRIPPAVCPYP